MNEWPRVLQDLLGQDVSAYRAQCRIDRPKAILEALPYAFSGIQFHVILAARAEWLSVLDLAGLSADAVREKTDRRGALSYQIALRDQRPAYAYFNMFRRGISNAEIEAFAAELRPLLPAEICGRVDITNLPR